MEETLERRRDSINVKFQVNQRKRERKKRDQERKTGGKDNQQNKRTGSNRQENKGCGVCLEVCETR